MKIETVKVEQQNSMISVSSERFLKRPYVKYSVEEFLRKRGIHVSVAGIDKQTYKLLYTQKA